MIKLFKFFWYKSYYVGSFAIKTLGGSPTIVEAPPIFENIQAAIKMGIGSRAEK